MRKLAFLFLLLGASVIPAFCQEDPIQILSKHFKTSEEFTVKVADAMPESDYDFKLTPAQMSFREQMVHLSQGLDYILSGLSGEKPNPPKPASKSKSDTEAFIRSSYERAIDRISKLTPEQLHKSYTTEEGTMTGIDMLLMALDHSTHHRASAEMYLRAKGITPPQYAF
jgi:uncharacterized damage-inducible protein DinB